MKREEVQKIADLARLELTPADLDRLGNQLSAILKYVEKLDELDVSQIEPTAHAVLIPTPTRPDELVFDATKADSLAQAPGPEGREGDFFKVPKVL